jgi:nucleotide-binding universal stress UspA family protein
MKILIAVDGSKFTKKMLAYITTHDDLFGASNDYTVLTVQHPLPGRASRVVGGSAVKSYYRDAAEAVLSPVCKFLVRHKIDAKSSHALGAPGVTIASFAEAGKFDLVVMGSHGHGALVKLVMGSVASQVIAYCKVPVLLVR